MSLFELDKLDEAFDLLIQNKYTHIRFMPELNLEQTLIMAYIESLLSGKINHNKLYLKSL